MAEEIRAAIEQVQGAQSCAAVMRSRAHWGPAAASLARIKVRSTCNGPAATACTSSPQKPKTIHALAAVCSSASAASAGVPPCRAA